ncbi:expressed unknown protein [Seminavis robusta]|uniref:Uncharacterized protein n=1 Tax=Seminavis robusta TaxID=568900 RepID=A0A9N8HQ30_9STRA|nr:expressed unknown protein [Seminavis robusta]|eukprot:Sro1241_g255440.1 n/a (114) ;mRNA; r:22223-22564
MHGGEFLKCLLRPSSTDDDAAKKYQEESGRVMKFEEGIEKAATVRGYNEEMASIKVAVMDIRAALEEKGIKVENEKSTQMLVKKVTVSLDASSNVRTRHIVAIGREGFWRAQK